MTWTDRLKEAAVGAVAVLVVVMVFILVQANLYGATPGEWLSFAGALSGTALAVAGALWIEHLKRRREERDAIKAVLTATRQLRSIVGMVLETDKDQAENQALLDAVGQTPDSLATYGVRLERALVRLTVISSDFDLIEAGEMVAQRNISRTKEFRSSEGCP